MKCHANLPTLVTKRTSPGSFLMEHLEQQDESKVAFRERTFRVSCFVFLISFPFLKEEAFSMSVAERFDFTVNLQYGAINFVKFRHILEQHP